MSYNTFRADAYHLMSLDRYLDNRKYVEEIITQEVINDWLKFENIPTASLASYVKTIRGFMKFRQSIGKKIYLPLTRKIIDSYIPYLYTDNEIIDILACLDSMSNFITRSIFPYIYVV